MSVKAALLGPVKELVPETGLSRRYALSSLINSVGQGMYISGTAVFATRVVGLTPQQVGVSLGAAGIAGLIATGALGALVDRFGARRIILAMSGLQAIGYVLYCFTRSFPAFLALACMLAAIAYVKTAANAALVSSVTAPDGRVRIRAQARALFNIGFTLGAGLCAVSLAIATTPAYYALPIGNAITYLLGALLVRTLPETPVTTGKRRSFTALRNLPFLSTVALNAVAGLHGTLAIVVIPLWLVTQTSAPAAMTGILLMLNTVLAMLFQVRASKGAETLAGGVRKERLAALLLLPACVLVGGSAGLSAVAAIVVLAGAYVLLTVGELFQTAGAWGISYSLAPPNAQGEYLGAFAMGAAAETFLGATVVTWLVFAHGAAGWWIVGIAILAGATAIGPAARAAAASLGQPQCPDQGERRTTGQRSARA